MDTRQKPVFLYLNPDSKEENHVDIWDLIKERNIKLVYWDLGGTLADISYKNKEMIVKEVNNACNSNVNVDLYDSAIEKEWGRRETLEAYKCIKAVKTPEDEQKYWIDFFSCILRELKIKEKYPRLVHWLAQVQVNPQSFEVFPYVPDALARLKEVNIPIGVISNAFPSAREIIVRTPLIQSLSRNHIILSCDTNTIKPEKEIYQKAIEVAGVKPNEILFIDDRSSFVEGAANLGIVSAKIKIPKMKPKSKKTENASRYEEMKWYNNLVTVFT